MKLRLRKVVLAILVLLLIDIIATVIFNAISGTGNLLDGFWVLLVTEGLIMMAICLALMTSHSKRMRNESLYLSGVGADADIKQSYGRFQYDEIIALLFGGIGFIFVFIGTIIAG